MHNQSSRTHAVLELEIVTRALLDACEAVIERQSELVPVAKRANGIYIEENVKGFMQTPEGKFVSNPDYQIDQTNIDAAEAKKKKKKKSSSNYPYKKQRITSTRFSNPISNHASVES